MKNWFTTIRNIFDSKELRSRLYHTFIYLILFRIGTFIILPGLDPTQIKKSTTGILALLDTLLNSSSLRSSSVFALGIAPYISASILMQVTSLTIPYFQRLKKEGPAGRQQLNKITRILTLIISPIQAAPYLLYILNKAHLEGGLMLSKAYIFPLGLIIITTGTMFCIWIADRITAKGIGNGSSILIAASIISSLPGALYMEYNNTRLLFFIIELLALFAIILIIISFMQGVRKIPLQYATQTSTPTGYGLRQYLPIGMNIAGVMPIIFAQTLTAMPLLSAKWLASRSTKAAAVARILQDQYSWQYNLILASLIFLATFFYAAIFINTTEMSDELKRSNGFIPGIKPGKSTADYIDSILSKIALPSSVFLVLIAILPVGAQKVIATGAMSRFFGGTSVLITVSVILDIIQRIESHLFNAYYGTLLQTSHPTLGNDS